MRQITKLTCVYLHEEHGRNVDGLYVEELHRVNGGDGESCGLFVRMVEFVEMLNYMLLLKPMVKPLHYLVQEWHMVDSVVPVGDVVLSQ